MALPQAERIVMQATKKPKKHYFSVEQANATLPLVRLIIRDIAALANKLREQHRRLASFPEGPAAPPQSVMDSLIAEIELGQEKMRQHEQELDQLHVELKDHFTGLIDFRGRVDGREVYLCWRLGEPEVAHWHELDAGFMGRQKLATVANH
jgi:hypothetical protein